MAVPATEVLKREEKIDLGISMLNLILNIVIALMLFKKFVQFPIFQAHGRIMLIYG